MPQELHHLPTHLQLGEIAVQVDPVQTLQIEAHVPVEHIVDRDRVDPNQTRRHDDLRNQTLWKPSMHPPAPNRLREHGTSAVSGEACLDE